MSEQDDNRLSCPSCDTKMAPVEGTIYHCVSCGLVAREEDVVNYWLEHFMDEFFECEDVKAVVADMQAYLNGQQEPQ